MEQEQLNTMIQLLEKEIAGLSNSYQILIKQTGKFPELKQIRIQLKEAQEKLRRLKKW